MKTFYIKQKLISLKDNFKVYDEQNQEVYEIEGSLLRIPKRYIIRDMQSKERAVITRKPISILPTFQVTVEGQYEFTLKKHLSFLKSRYTIEGEGVEIQGDLWDMDFVITHKANPIGQVKKDWLTFGDTYKIDVLDEAWEMIIITLVVAVDRVKDEQSNTVATFDF